MWHEGVWPGHGGGVDVFDSRPEMATAKALLINSALPYAWTAPDGCAFGDLDRAKQGWGTADLQELYDSADRTLVIDGTDIIAPLGSRTLQSHPRSAKARSRRDPCLHRSDG